ncbi:MULTISPECIES: hypothetical protein [unclassified Streptomyces]|nr:MULTISPECIES: hypothetical protein [unclassified Streptomyces]
MKLGKALATGVAQERQQPRDEQESPGRPVEIQQEQQPRTAAPEEVPAAR